MSTTAFKGTREEIALLRSLENSAPSEFAKAIVANRPEFTARQELAAIAKSEGISVSELSGDIIAARAMNGIVELEFNGGANSPADTMDVSIVPAKETFPSKFEAGYTEIELMERRSIVRARILAEHATRPDYRYARELLNRIGRDYGAVVSSMPIGDVKVFAVKRAINPERAIVRSERERAIVASIVAHVESTESAIAKAPLNKIPPALQRELNKAEDSLKAARARFDKAELAVRNSETPTADGLRLELAEQFDAFEDGLPLFAAIASMELPGQIIRRPFPEYMRPRIRRSPVSPVECEVLRNEMNAAWEEFQLAMSAFIAALLDSKAKDETLEFESTRSQKNKSRTENNAEFKAREAERKRNARRRNK